MLPLEEKQDLVLFTGMALFDLKEKLNFNNEATGSLFPNDTNHE